MLLGTLKWDTRRHILQTLISQKTGKVEFLVYKHFVYKNDADTNSQRLWQCAQGLHMFKSDGAPSFSH